MVRETIAIQADAGEPRSLLAAKAEVERIDVLLTCEVERVRRARDHLADARSRGAPEDVLARLEGEHRCATECREKLAEAHANAVAALRDLEDERDIALEADI